MKFYSEKYSSDIMSLVVLGCETIDELTSLVVDKFAAVKQKSDPVKYDYKHPLREQDVKVIIMLRLFFRMKSLLPLLPRVFGKSKLFRIVGSTFDLYNKRSVFTT